MHELSSEHEMHVYQQQQQEWELWTFIGIDNRSSTKWNKHKQNRSEKSSKETIQQPIIHFYQFRSSFGGHTVIVGALCLLIDVGLLCCSPSFHLSFPFFCPSFLLTFTWYLSLCVWVFFSLLFSLFLIFNSFSGLSGTFQK